MKILILSLILLSFNAHSSDGAYDCSSTQKNNFNYLGNYLLQASSYISKAEEMNNKGDHKVLLEQLNKAEHLLKKFDNRYKDSKFCYSFKKQANYLSLTSNKLRIKLNLHRQSVSLKNSCQFSFNKIRNTYEKFTKIKIGTQKSYIEISKTLKRTNLLIESRTCDKNQKEELYSFFDLQSKELENLYLKIRSVSKL